MEQFGIVHLQPHLAVPSELGVYPIWKTCLRQIVFVNPSALGTSPHQQYEILYGPESQQFLIEVLCGLHSPLLGENEVFGQFKQFLELNASHEVLIHQQKSIQFILQEVKRIRAQYIHQLGSKSYGSLLRKLTGDVDEVALFGTGQFSEEILPWLSHKKKIQMIGRNTERLKFFEGKYPHITISQIHNSNATKTVIAPCLIIAASVSNESLLDYLKRSDLSQLKTIFDLRGLPSEKEEHLWLNLMRAAGFQQDVIFLRDLFRNMESQRQQNLQLINAIKAEISEKVLAFLNRLEHRPLGWDDLCA